MNRIREFRKKKGLTLKQLGAMVSMAESTVSKYENGINEPDLATLNLIADALGASIDDLLGRTTEHPAVEEKPDNSPKTPEARIISIGVDRMTKEQREQALAVLRAMFAQHPELFEEATR